MYVYPSGAVGIPADEDLIEDVRLAYLPETWDAIQVAVALEAERKDLRVLALREEAAERKMVDRIVDKLYTRLRDDLIADVNEALTNPRPLTDRCTGHNASNGAACTNRPRPSSDRCGLHTRKAGPTR